MRGKPKLTLNERKEAYQLTLKLKKEGLDSGKVTENILNLFDNKLTRDTIINWLNGSSKPYRDGSWNKGKKGVQVPWNKGLTKETDSRMLKISQNLQGNTICKDAIAAGTWKPWHKGLTKEDEPRIAALGKARKGKPFHHKEETKQRIREFILDKYNHDPIYRKNHAEATTKGVKDFWNDSVRSSITRESIRKTVIKLWQDPDYVTKQLKARFKHPSGLEQRIIDVIGNYNLPYRYTGDFSLHIGHRYPDFECTVTPKKVVNVNGDYWHQNEDEKEIKAEYTENGWELSILWEHDINRMTDDEIAAILKVFAFTPEGDWDTLESRASSLYETVLARTL